MKRTILVVDDEPKIREVIVSYLHQEGYDTLEASSGAAAVERVRNAAIDLVVLDLRLPDMPGEEVCRRIRLASSLPVLMLTAKAAEEERIRGLSLGADDYVTKPFSPRELIARVRAILRRTQEDALLADRISFLADELVIDTVRHEVFREGREVALTPIEYKLLLVLARHPGRHYTRDDLIAKAFGFDFAGDARTVDQHIKNLRHKIERTPKQPTFIVTVYGVGYRFQGEVR